MPDKILSIFINFTFCKSNDVIIFGNAVKRVDVVPPLATIISSPPLAAVHEAPGSSVLVFRDDCDVAAIGCANLISP